MFIMEKILFDKSDFIGKQTSQIEKDYKLLGVLGQGAYSVVYKAVHRKTQIVRCIKKIAIAKFTKNQKEDIMNEIKMLTKVDHAHIMKIMEYYQNEKYLFIVTEYLDGGELFDKIELLQTFSEAEAANYMSQILMAVSYLHSMNIIHRDIKPENIVLSNKDHDANLKLIDFGTSREVEGNQKLQARMGTAYYIAPEVLRKNYDVKCDIWSCGIILYVLLCGYPPFNGSTEKKIIQRILKGQFTFPVEEWGKVSQNAKDLIKKMLTLDPEKRPSADQLLKEPWFSNRRKSIFDDKSHQIVINHLKNFKAKAKLQKAILLYIANFFDLKEEKARLQETFELMDTNFDGKLSKDELIQAYSQMYDKQTAELYVKEIFEAVDFNDSKTLDFSEFMVANINYKKNLNNKSLEKIFNVVDEDGSGFISHDELRKFLNYEKGQNDQLIDDMIKEVDEDNDKQISFNEFKAMMEGFYNKL